MSDVVLTIGAQDQASPELKKIGEAAKKHLGDDVKEAAEKGEAASESLAGMFREDLTRSFFTAEASFDILKESISKGLEILKEFVVSSVESRAEQEKAERQRAAALRNLGYDADLVGAALKEQAEAFRSNLGVSADLVTNIQALLTRFHVAPEVMGKATQAILDYSTATGADAHEATMTLLRAIENGGKGLGRMGIEFHGTGDKAKDFSRLMDQLEKQFNGSASAATDTLSGRVSVLSGQWTALKETFGGFIEFAEQKTGLLQTITDSLKAINFLASDKGTADAMQTGLQEQRNAEQKLLDQRKEAVRKNEAEISELRKHEGNAGIIQSLETQRQRDLAFIAEQTKKVEGLTAALRNAYSAEADVDKQREDALKKKVPPGGTDDDTEKRKQAHDKKAQQERQYAKEAEEAKDYDLSLQRKFAEAEHKVNEEAERQSDEDFKKGLADQKKLDEEKARQEEEAEKKEREELQKHFEEMDRAAKEQADRMQKEGVNIGAALINGIRDGLRHSKESGEPFNWGEFIKGLLPLAIEGALMVGTGGASAPFNPLIGAGVGLATDQFHDGGWVGGAPHYAYGGWIGQEQDTIRAWVAKGERVLSPDEIFRMGGSKEVDRMAKGGSGGARNYYISAMDALSMRGFMARQGGTGFVQSVDDAGGETAQLINRMRRGA